MMIRYYLRHVDYFYSDEAMYAVHGLMNLTDSYNTFAEADAKRWTLQQRALQGIQLEDWDTISSINQRTPELEERWAKLGAYIEQEFGDSSFLEIDEFATQRSGTKKYVPSRDYYLPKTLTIKQAKQLTELTGINQYLVVEVDEGNPPFFGVYRLGNYGQTEGWVKTNAVFYDGSSYQEDKVPVIFTDKATMLSGGGELLYEAFQGLDESQLNRPLEELTDTPALLRAYVNSVRYGLSIDDQDRLKLSYPEMASIGLNEFLRTKIFEFRPVSLETVLKYRGYQAVQ